METGKRIALFRKSKRLTQEGLASILDVSRSYLAEIESGKKEPSFNFLMSLIAATDVSSDWLLTGQGVMTRSYSAIPFEEIPKERIKNWLDEFWSNANEKQKVWLEIQMEKTFPEFYEWIKKNEGGNQRRHAGTGFDAG